MVRSDLLKFTLETEEAQEDKIMMMFTCISQVSISCSTLKVQIECLSFGLGDGLTPKEGTRSTIDIGSLPLLPTGPHRSEMERLSVLVLDHDPVSLITISNTLAKFNFKVDITTAEKPYLTIYVLPFQTAEEALDSLRRGVAKVEGLDLILAEVHPGKTPVGTLMLFLYVLNEVKVPLITMCVYDELEAVSQRMTRGGFNVVKPLGSQDVNILMMTALQHRSGRVIPEGSSIVKKTRSRMDSSSTKYHGPDTEEDEEQDVLNSNDYSRNLGRFVWSSELHEKFLQAVEVLGLSATPLKIHRYMNIKGLNLNIHHIASHLQKHQLREQRLAQAKDGYQHYASMKHISEMISSAYNVASSQPINHPTTAQMQVTHGVQQPGVVWPQQAEASSAASFWDKCPGAGKLWGHVGQSSAQAQVSMTSARPSAVSEHGSKSSVWDRYNESLQYYDESPEKRLSLTYKRRMLPVKSEAIDQYGGKVVNLEQPKETSHTEAAGEPVIDLEREIRRRIEVASKIVITQEQPKQTSRTEAAGKPVINPEREFRRRIKAASKIVIDQKKEASRTEAAGEPVIDLESEIHRRIEAASKIVINKEQLKETSRTEAAGEPVIDLEREIRCRIEAASKIVINQEQPKETSRTEAAGEPVIDLESEAGKIVINLESDTLLEDTMNEALAAVTLQKDKENHHHTAEKAPPESFFDFEAEKFWKSHLEGQEQQGLAPNDLLQVDDAWNQVLQQANPANVGDAPVVQTDDAPVAQEPAPGDAPAPMYDPGNQLVTNDVLWAWSPQFAGNDYGMPF